MKKAYYLIPLTVLLLFSLFGCSETEKITRETQAEILLESNPTTGFEWSAAIADSTVCSLVSEDFVFSDNADSLVGAPGNQRFVFEGVAPGETEVTFTYARSWETDGEKTVCRYRIRVYSDLTLDWEQLQ